MTTYRTGFIADITISDKLARTLAERMSEAVEDTISGLATDIACQYLDPSDEDLEGDDWVEQVETPLFDRILNQVLQHLLPAD